MDVIHRNALQPGEVVEGFEVIQVLRPGGFGLTYIMEQGGRAFAVKEYFPEGKCIRRNGKIIVSDMNREHFDWGLIRFKREIKILSRHLHRNIARCLGGFKTDQTAYMVMDYVRGEPLDDVISAMSSNGVQVTEAAILNLLFPLLDALQSIHGKHLIHRDLKPPNIYLESDGTPVLLDFGAARKIEPGDRNDVTRYATPGFTPPEQYVRSAAGQGPWSDIYSLGVCAWQMLTGGAPQISEIRQRKVNAGGRDVMGEELDDLRGSYSDPLIDAIKMALNVFPGQRPQSARDWRAMFPPSPDPDDLIRGVDSLGDNVRTEADPRVLAELVTRLATMTDYGGADREFQNELISGGKGPAMVIIAAGGFTMGADDDDDQAAAHERPSRYVSIEYRLAVGKFPVSFKEYDRFADATDRERPNDGGWGRGKRPVINVSWLDAVAYASWLSGQTGRDYRLLSEAEWEYVARAGTQTRYYWGNQIDPARANYDGCGAPWDGRSTSEVDIHPANPFGLHDCCGNVGEWVLDHWHDSYHDAPSDGRAWLADDGGHRVVRGGSWFQTGNELRCSARMSYREPVRSRHIGFRVARAG